MINPASTATMAITTSTLISVNAMLRLRRVSLPVKEKKKMKTTIGVDLHKEAMTCVVLDEQGAVLERREIATKCRKQVADYFGSDGLQSKVAVESVGFYQWFWDLVRPRVGRLRLADPAGVRAFAGRKAKTDRNDALLLANLLREDRLPFACVPGEPVRALRELVRHRISVARNKRRNRTEHCSKRKIGHGLDWNSVAGHVLIAVCWSCRHLRSRFRDCSIQSC